jgi:AbrB family looped-hinge helix DNA binding protein
LIEITATINSENQVTLPAEVRRRLGLGPADNVAFVLGEDDRVELRKPRYDLESVIGSSPAVPGESLDLEREIEAATEEVILEKARRKGW